MARTIPSFTLPFIFILFVSNIEGHAGLAWPGPEWFDNQGPLVLAPAKIGGGIGLCAGAGVGLPIGLALRLVGEEDYPGVSILLGAIYGQHALYIVTGAPFYAARKILWDTPKRAFRAIKKKPKNQVSHHFPSDLRGSFESRDSRARIKHRIASLRA